MLYVSQNPLKLSHHYHHHCYNYMRFIDGLRVHTVVKELEGKQEKQYS